ncbi:MAG: hypothetical protein ACO1N7_09035 [Sphingobacteriaceae bacterium]
MTWIKKLDFTRWAIANFVILAFFGAVLRYMVCFPAGLNYLNILHAHSHFAFSGWTFLALAFLIFKQLKEPVSGAFQWMLVLTLLCSFGMLFSFSVQGYKFVSISFSTLFLVVTYWFSYLVYRKLQLVNNTIFRTLIKAGIWCLVLSSIGPLALGALKASGNTGIIYQNAIYFYLHFQLNGWMLFATLGLIAISFLKLESSQTSTKVWLMVFIISSIPLFFIFTLWAKPPQWVFLLAFISACFNAASWFILGTKLWEDIKQFPFLVKFALLAISIKVVFQLFVCIPVIGEWTFLNRNLIIGYVHLITLGSITPVIINQFVKIGRLQSVKTLNKFYCSLTVLYLVILFLQPLLNLYGMLIPHFQYCLFAISVLFCITGLSYYYKLLPQRTLINFSIKKRLFTTPKYLYESNN